MASNPPSVAPGDVLPDQYGVKFEGSGYWILARVHNGDAQDYTLKNGGGYVWIQWNPYFWIQCRIYSDGMSSTDEPLCVVNGVMNWDGKAGKYEYTVDQCEGVYGFKQDSPNTFTFMYRRK
jgi:hypothetical protein